MVENQEFKQNELNRTICLQKLEKLLYQREIEKVEHRKRSDQKKQVLDIFILLQINVSYAFYNACIIICI